MCRSPCPNQRLSFLLLLYTVCSVFTLDIRNRNLEKNVAISRHPKTQAESTVSARGDRVSKPEAVPFVT